MSSKAKIAKPILPIYSSGVRKRPKSPVKLGQKSKAVKRACILAQGQQFWSYMLPQPE